MNFPRLAGLDDDTHPGALLGTNEMMVYSARRQKGAHWDSIRAGRAIGEHD